MSLLDKPGESSSGASSIPLYIVGGVATVWDAQTAATIHCAHDVSGLRAGTLPGVVQQNGFLGLPVTLMPEEATHLVRNGIAHLVPVPDATLAPPSAQLVAERTAQRIARSRALAERVRLDEETRAAEGKAKYAARNAASAAKAATKREERTRKRAEAARAAAVANGGDEGAGQEAYDGVYAAVKAKEAADEAKAAGSKDNDEPKERPVATADNTNLFTVVPALPVHPSLTPSTPTTLTSAAFPFPHPPAHSLHVRDSAVADTFSALHARGLRMGLGPRFGGEWLVYPGDYLRYHAHYTSQVVVRDDPIRPAELVAWGRLGTGTKKAGLICCWDDGGRGEDDAVKGKGEVEFIAWSGPTLDRKQVEEAAPRETTLYSICSIDCFGI